jgi:hypothetical protein
MGLHAAELPADVASLTNGALTALLQRAEEEERAMSHHRRVLHARIDNIPIGSGALPESEAELLCALQLEERALSEVRLQLHLRITELRLERGRRLA